MLGFCENTQVETEVQARGAVVCWKASADRSSAEGSSAGVRAFHSAGAGLLQHRDFTEGWDGRRYYECNW